ncbi:MAG TPA: hypothetical protein VL651_03095, partial [Bacteroidia bacterium]|nr:hypothetical protein [Bacteroidia bacterium]
MKKQLLTSLLAVSCALLNAQSTQTIWTMTNGGGANNGGTIVKMNPDGTGLTPVYDFLYAT